MDGLVLLKKPLSFPLEAKNTSRATKKLTQLFPFCAYCHDEYKGKTLHDQAVILTYDHITPQSKGSGSKPLANGLLACSPCNSSRGNSPLLTYLTGGSGLPLDVSGTTREHRQKSFAEYLRFYVENRVRLQPTMPPNSWFNDALEHFLSPIQAPLKSTFEQGIAFFGFLAKQDPGFWLGSGFSRIVSEDFARYPEKQALLQNILAQLKSATLRFSGQKAA